jgi:hypothetical protein
LIISLLLLIAYPYDSTFETYLDEITKQLAPQNSLIQQTYANKTAVAGPDNVLTEEYPGYLINSQY